MKALISFILLLVICHAQVNIVAVTPLLSEREVSEFTNAFSEHIFASQAGEITVLVDGYNAREIAHFVTDNRKSMQTSKGKMRAWAAEIQKAQQFFANMKPNQDENLHGALSIPDLHDFIQANYLNRGVVINKVLLVGSPLYRNQTEATYSIMDKTLPSDQHILSTRKQTPYGLVGYENGLSKIGIEWFMTVGGASLTKQYKEALLKFYSLYFEKAGATQIAMFSDDLTTSFRNLRALPISHQRYKIDKSTGFSMIRYNGREFAPIDHTPEGLDAPPSLLPTPPIELKGVKCAISWNKKGLDLDIILKKPDGTVVSPRNGNMPGVIFHDDVGETTRVILPHLTYEEFSKWKVFLNIYSGKVKGSQTHGDFTVIAEDGKQWDHKFKINACDGSKGVVHGGSVHAENFSGCIHWTVIKLPPTF